jgi:anion-transporting  ArsA/GET3 family ATPase
VTDAYRPLPPPLDVDAILDDPRVRIVVCCGAGGVGKTTTAAALALRAAERGRTTVVLTIDPARRLAQSMGLSELDNVPRAVAGLELPGGGSLDAMMLDMKRTFDEVVLEHASPEKAEQILGNSFYQALSSSFSGTQEYMAMEKLGQLRARDEWDLIVVDTPPSRSALDFLDAPTRLGSFLDGRLIRILTAPARAGGKAYLRAVTFGISAVTNALTKVLGGELLVEVQTFVAALDTMFGGFRERAEQTYALLQDPETRFLVVAAPERDAIREASYFVERLATDAMPLGGLVLNRVHRSAATDLEEARSAEAAHDLRVAPPATLDPEAARLTAAVLDLHADRMQTIHRERRMADRFVAAHLTVPAVAVPALATDVHDLDGLREVGAALATSHRAPAEA